MTGLTYASPILDDVAHRACAELVTALPRGMAVRELAEAIGANPETVYSVLLGASVTYADRLFVPAGKRCSKGRPLVWTVRGMSR